MRSMHRLLIVSAVTLTVWSVSPAVKTDSKQHSILYDRYLKKGHFETPMITQLFLLMTSEQLNASLRDIQKVLRKIIKNDLAHMDEWYWKGILEVCDKVSLFVEQAWVQRKTKRIFVPKQSESKIGAQPLLEHWERMELEYDQPIHWYKFCASWIDYLVVLIHAYLHFPCWDRESLYRVEDLFYLVEHAQAMLAGSETFSGYYEHEIPPLKTVFLEWKDGFENEEAKKKGDRRAKGESA